MDFIRIHNTFHRKAFNIKSRLLKLALFLHYIYLGTIVTLIKQLSPTTQIVWDTVVKSSTTFDFLD
jgi:hydroxymethylpyrimidine/phosphomethylpyrimidine kinase